MIIYHYNPRVMRKILIYTLFFFIPLIYGHSQGSDQLKINEIMVRNDSTIIDQYGNRSGWIEIFNTDYKAAGMGGLYLSNDTANPKMYPISKNDPETNLKKRGYYLFYADNKPYRGTSHLNFTLEESEYVALYDSDGKTLLDIIPVPEEIKEMSNQSFGREEDGEGDFVNLKRYTPGATNTWKEAESKSNRIAQLDPYGVGMIIVAMSVVFACLVFIFIMLKLFRVFENMKFKKYRKAQPEETQTATEGQVLEDTSGEAIAAISMALHLHTSNIHDIESEIITICHAKRTYSPWGSKHLVLKKNPKI